MLDVPASKITTGKTTVSVFQVKKWVVVVSVELRSGIQKTLPQAADTASSVSDSSADSRDPESDVPIVENEIVEEDSPWDLIDLTSKDDCASSTLQRTQELCRSYGGSVPSDVRSVQGAIKDGLAAFASAGGDEVSFVDVEGSHTAA